MAALTKMDSLDCAAATAASLGLQLRNSQTQTSVACIFSPFFSERVGLNVTSKRG